MERFDVCPICSQKLAPPPPPFCLRGLSPSGTMVVSISSQTFCQGCWAPDGGIIISYFMPGGHQEEYHSHPGTPFPNTHLKAYLPYNEQGIKLLRRLQFAFLNGLIWTVETATHSGALVSSIRLGPIPHKLHPCHYTGEGAAETLNDSFPDPFYWDRCNQELDRWGVPSFEQCQGYIVEGRWKERQLDANYGVAMSNMQGLQHATSACRTLLKGLQNHQHGWMFCKALPGTLDNKKIEKPMDLSTVEKKLNHDTYATLEEFTEDILLTFDNALATNGKENPVHFMAKQLKRKFKKDLKDLLATTTTYTRERNS